jgi:phosphoribosylformimino-5-aminoimidazole carboxamide ribotide isomerase
VNSKWRKEMKFRPCIDIHNGKVKQIIGSTLSQDTAEAEENFVATESAAYFAEMFKRDNLSGGHVIMLGPGNETEAISCLKVFPNGLQVGGGINKTNALDYLQAGASHVIVSSAIFKDGLLDIAEVKKISEITGKPRLVIDLSCKFMRNSYFVAINKWNTVTEFEITKGNLDILAAYCDEFLIHAVDSEGKKQGPDIRLVELIGGISPIKVTYAGGISTMEDIDIIAEKGKCIVDFTVGSNLDIFGGQLSYREIASRFAL